jgi:putative chitinase
MITKQLLDRLFPITGLDPKKYNLVRDRGRLLSALNTILPKYGIDSYVRLAAFFGNCGIETDYFKTTIEYASGDAYEGRKDLGNTQPGDGRRFKGRGLSQTTGRFNYEAVQKAIGAKLGIDIMKTPELLGDVDIAVESACIFWQDHNLNAYADRGEFKQLSGIVNRGSAKLTPLQWPKRNDLYIKCLRLIPKDIAPDVQTDGQKSDVLSTKVDISSPQPPLSQTATTLVSSNNSGISAIDGQSTSPDFLVDAIDKNVTPAQVKDAGKTMGLRLWRFLIRPLSLIYAALEAGNIAAWLGVAVLVAAIALLIYWHRAEIRQLFAKLKAKVLA